MEAANVSNDEDTEKWTPVFLRPCSYSIPPTSVYIGQLGKLNSEGKLYKVLPDGGLYDVTPYVESSAYYRYAAPTHTKHDLILDAPSGDPGGEPSDGNRQVFTDTQPGVLTLVLRAHLRGGASVEKILDLVRFEVDDIPGSSEAWHTDNPNGRPTANGSEFTATVTFTTLPADNSSFGKKFARVLLDGQVVDSKCWWAFYTADAYNYPGAPTPPPDVNDTSQLPEAFWIPRNYFYYYMQTEAGAGCRSECCNSPGFHDQHSSTLFGPQLPQLPSPPYPYRVQISGNDRLGLNPIKEPGANANQGLAYIDRFAWTVRHEKRHHDNYHSWWPFPEQYSEALDGTDGDSIPAGLEPSLPGGPYSSSLLDSHPNDAYPAAVGGDNERVTCITADVWNPLNSKLWDWAKPGKNWCQEP